MMEPYAYDHFHKSLLQEDRSLHGGPKPGEALHFELRATDGDIVRSRAFVGRKPLFVYFGSVT